MGAIVFLGLHFSVGRLRYKITLLVTFMAIKNWGKNSYMEDLSLGSLCGVRISRGEAWLTFSRITSYIQKMCGNCDQGRSVLYLPYSSLLRNCALPLSL